MQPNNNWTPYLLELRKRLLFCIVTILLIFSVLFYFANDLYHIVALPLLKNLPLQGKMIATTVPGPFWVPLKWAFMLAVFVAIPLVLYQLWSFIMPALYAREKHLLWLLLWASVFLFYLGMLFAYFAVFPLLFKFLLRMAPPDVSIMPDIGHYLDFVLKLFFAFGIAFEVPVIVIVLVRSGVVSITALTKARPYMIIGAFVLGMLLTPPDVVSQILLAIPLWFLFEIGIISAKLIVRFNISWSLYNP